MRLCRFIKTDRSVAPGLILRDDRLLDLTRHGIAGLTEIIDSEEATSAVARLDEKGAEGTLALDGVRLVSPLEDQEVWAAGVTYLRSKKARMEESDFSATAYDKVYEAERPEIFFKSIAEKVVAVGETVGIRKDARWSVPEPELVLIFDSRGAVKGYSIGNDMSSRDIEGENILYLPQAKIYRKSCAIGPWIVLGPTEKEARGWSIRLEIIRDGAIAFHGETTVDKIRRGFGELGEFLFRSQEFPRGAALLTGTGVVPPDGFTLAERDEIRIEISGVGRLINRVEVV